MAKVSEESKKRYAQKIQEFKAQLEAIGKRQKKAEAAAAAASGDGGYNRLISANESLNLVSHYVLMNSISVALLGIKNENFLNEARKTCYRCIIDLEKAVSAGIDVPFSDYADKLALIDAFGDKARYGLVRKLSLAIDTVQEEYGANSKWRWSFVELEGRYATIAKNFINMKTFVSKMDPNVDGYEIRMAHLKLVQQLLRTAADRYREKYELSTHRRDDMKLGIDYLQALRRMLVALGETTEAEVTKRKAETWSTKLESDSKKTDAAKKRSAQKGGAASRR